MLFVLYQMASGGGPGFRLRRQGRLAGFSSGRRHGRDLSADGRRDRRFAAPVAAGAANRAGRRRRDGALRRHDGDGRGARSSRFRSRSPAKSSTSQCFPSTDRFCISACRAAPSSRSTSSTTSRSGAPTVCPDSRRHRDRLRRSPSMRPPTPPRPGVLCVIVEGPIARQIVRARRGRTQRAILDELVERFGSKAGAPVDTSSRTGPSSATRAAGCSATRRRVCSPSSVRALREPCGRIHWAGTESSAVMCGWVDGAVRSGERAATEVMQSERVGSGVTVGRRSRHHLYMTTQQIASTRQHTVDVVGGLLARYGLVIVIAWYGGLKFMDYEARGHPAVGFGESLHGLAVRHLLRVTPSRRCWACSSWQPQRCLPSSRGGQGCRQSEACWRSCCSSPRSASCSPRPGSSTHPRVGFRLCRWTAGS